MGLMMKRFIPSPVEIAIFVTMAVICAAAVGQLNAASHDLAMSVLAMPIFFVSAVLGLRRSPVWRAAEERETPVVPTRDEIDLA
jgi:hypothetical protein